jgi:hypothetical protein
MFFGLPLSVSFHCSCPYSHVTWGMNNRPIGICSSETYSHPINMKNTTNPTALVSIRKSEFHSHSWKVGNPFYWFYYYSCANYSQCKVFFTCSLISVNAIVYLLTSQFHIQYTHTKMAFWGIAPCSLVVWAYYNEDTQHSIPEGYHLYICRHENLKYHNIRTHCYMF